jgi:hypothetical protein
MNKVAQAGKAAFRLGKEANVWDTRALSPYVICATLGSRFWKVPRSDLTVARKEGVNERGQKSAWIFSSRERRADGG